VIQNPPPAPAADAAADPPGVLSSIFGWEPMVWTIRVGLLVVFSVTLYIFILNTLRFFRPVLGPLPRLRQIGGKIAGVEATASLADSDASISQRLTAVNERMLDLVQYVEGLAAQVGYAPGERDDDEA
jgi:hypothetical protein